MTAYRTVKQSAQSESVIMRSRFISRCRPVADEDEALSVLSSVRAEFPDASHTCYAYRVGERGTTERYSDAGEPQGTAGMPILEVLRTHALTNVIVTVTRYFGGVLLGTGGLSRAYGGGALDCVRAAKEIELIPAVKHTLDIDYPRYGALEGYIRLNSAVTEVAYSERVRVTVLVEEGRREAFAAELFDRSGGKVSPEYAGAGLMERELQ